MATVTVTKQFKEDFDIWAADSIRSGDFTAADMDELKDMLRKEFKPGPDQLRDGYAAINAAGVEIPAAIDDYVERIRVWTAYFSAYRMSKGKDCAVGINDRMRHSIAEKNRKAA